MGIRLKSATENASVGLNKLSREDFLEVNLSDDFKMANFENYHDMKMITPKAFDNYIDEMIGDYRAELEMKTFTDRRQTTYLEAIKYTAALIWNCYGIKQLHDPFRDIVNKDVIDVVLLSLHPNELIKEKEISAATKEALSIIEKFKDLILLNDSTEKTAQTWAWVKAATHDRMSKSYPAQMCLLAWFLTLVSKMTGFKIPGVEKMLVGGRIKKETEDIVVIFTTMQYIAQAMFEKNHVNFLAQYHILKVMHKDLNKMMSKF